MEQKMSRYLITHPSISPEDYDISSDPRKVKALYVPCNKNIPEVMYDTPKNLRSKFLKDSSNMQFVALHPAYHMYLDSFLQVQIHNVNLCATFLYRSSIQTFLGINPSTSIYGDVLFFGSVSPMTNYNHDVDYSVPYELIEQVARYFDYKFVFNVE